MTDREILEDLIRLAPQGIALAVVVAVALVLFLSMGAPA